MDRTTRTPETPAAHYASYVVRVWRPSRGALPARVDIEHVQSGQRVAVDAGAFADLVARLAAGFPSGPAPPAQADQA